MVLLPQVFGPSGMLSGFFTDPQNVLYALAFLVPLIILYLIRPRPQNVAVPSLMFILNDMGRSTVHRFFRTIFRDVLFLLQALAILLLALALAKPFINVSQESLVQQSIIIVDTSASTRAFHDARFEDIRKAAIDAIANDNIVIVDHANPQLLSENDNPHLSASRAKALIKDIQPTDMEGDLPTSLDLAMQYANAESKVVIVSDFVLSNLESQELIDAKLKVLRSKGAIIDIKPVTKQGNNVGIIDASLNSQNATLDIKVQNFNDRPAQIGLSYNGNDISLPRNLLDPQGKPGSLLDVSIPVVHGKSEIVLSPNDDFDTDNHYYVSIPDRDAINVLLITNDQDVQKSRLIPALQAAGDQFTKVNVQYGVPPKIPDLNHDVYIIKDVNTDFMLPGVLKDLHDRVDAGAVLVIFAQDNLFNMNMQDLLPVQYEQADPLGGKQQLITNTSLGLMKGLSDIGQVNGNQLLRVQKTADAVVHAYVVTNNGPEPVIAHRRIGKGVVIYYGIKDQKIVDLDPQSYAVIWGRILDYSLADPAVLNTGTGAVIQSATRDIITPQGKQPSPVVATRAGIYLAGTTAIAANLYPVHFTTATTPSNVQYESVISESANISATGVGEGKQSETKVPQDLSNYLLFIGMAVMLLELLYIKFRGDL